MNRKTTTRTRLRVVHRLVRVFAPHFRLLVLSALLVLTSVALGVVAPLFLRMILDDALPAHDTAELLLLCGGMILAGALVSLVSLQQGKLTHRVGQRVVHKLRMEVFDRVQRSPLPFFASEPNSRIQSILISDIGEISDVVTFSMQAVLISGVGMLAAICVIMALSWQLGVLSILLALGLSIVNRRLAKRRFGLTNERQDRIADMMRYTGEDLSYSGVVVGRTLGRTGAQRARFLAASQDTADLTFRERMAGRAGYAWIGVALSCVPPVIYGVAGTAFPEVSIGTIIVIAMLQMRLTGPIENLMEVSADIQSSLAVFKRVFEYLDLEDRVFETDAAVEPAESGAASSPAAPLTLNDVGYGYPGADRTSVSEVSLEIAGGGVTVLVGASGSGKSTLGLILAGLLSPTRGSVSCADRTLTEAELRRRVTLVPQEAPIFNSSVRENLLFGRPAASEKEMLDVLGIVRLDALIDSLPDGLDAIVGERGYEFSGGERQRLALARALLSPSPVLVLDEAISALDAVTGKEVYESLQRYRGDRSLVFIAHRIPALNDDDTVVLLDKGRVAERGTHGGLLLAGGAYSGLVGSQMVMPAAAR
ncbi:ABC transporter ATP-binding protein [Streptosporangium amethystogenes]|uniref:ABC transporter ATP-binding protein n=1 Tax=Streptosporangium amethystogenes TaxID=2002 RepID=UPI00068E2EC2|nr:ABC transporter ATP-binding protein [Streptosporangium amethystogenes]